MGTNTRITLLTPAGTAARNVTFNVGGTQRMVNVFVDGLSGAETAAVELLKATDVDGPDSLAIDANWMACMVDGAAVTFTATNNVRAFLVPGVYRIKLPASASNTTAGVYYGA